MAMVASFRHSRKALFPMDVTELGIFTEVNSRHPQNIWSGIWVIELGRTAVAKCEHSQKTPVPRLVSELGSVMDVRAVQ